MNRRWRSSLLRLCAMVFAACALLPGRAAVAAEPDSPTFGVAYPDMREPFRSIFESIIAGIAEQSGVEVRRLALAPDSGTDAAARWLESESIDAAICLGNRARTVLTPLKARVPMLIGGVLSSPELLQEGWHGVVLNAHPASLFEQLLRFVPGVRRVHVVHTREADDWLMDLAARAAEERGIVLVKHLVRTPTEASLTFRRIIGDIEGHTDAIWLLQNQEDIGMDTLLPFILKQSWDLSVPVFSSAPSHVRQGALFSVFPDHRAIGRHLAERLRAMLATGGDRDPPLEAARAVKLVVNLRTLEHLGIELTKDERDRIELKFPDR